MEMEMSRHLLTRNVSSESMHAFLNNFANRLQTDRQTDRQTNKHGGKNVICMQIYFSLMAVTRHKDIMYY